MSDTANQNDEALAVTKDDVGPTTPPRKNDMHNTIDEFVKTPSEEDASENVLSPERAEGTVPPLARTGITTPVRSRPTTPFQSESPLPITPVPSRVNLNISVKTSDEDEEQEGKKWSEALRTPSTEAQFSPSKPLNKPGSLHGLGKIE